MTTSGFSFIRNGISFDYPFRESILSLLPLVDEFVIAVGDSSDATRESIVSLQDPKIRIMDTTWDDSLRTGGEILSQQTNVALDHIRGDWGFYLQGDEIIHEHDYDMIRSALNYYAQRPEIEGLLFNYIHFYGSFNVIGDSRKWYRREIRVVRNGVGVRSWGDAQGFRRQGQKLRVAHIPARIFHYGWVKSPHDQAKKLKNFHTYWHSDQWVADRMQNIKEYSYNEGGRLKVFTGMHPTVMHERISRAGWTFDPEKSMQNIPVKDRILNMLEDVTGWRAGEYRNYILEDTFRG